jgi:serine/threonine protein kinase
VVYRPNKNNPDSLETRILTCKERRVKYKTIVNILKEILPSISQFYPTVTCVTLKTEGGKLTASVTEDVNEIIHYLPIPAHLSHIPTAPITELQKVEGLSTDVDRVEWQGQTWAFKLTGPSLEGTLRELSILDQLSNSPYIIKLKAIIVNHDYTIRGFLTPFMYHGDLTTVFDTARTDRGLRNDSDDVVFDWQLKLSWARQITRGVMDLHAISAYNGDLKPQNVLVDSESRAILVDFCPMGFTDDYVAPEILAALHGHETACQPLPTAAADVYSLGLILHAVAEEKSSCERPPLWRDGKTPSFYREIVQRCLAEDPAARPSIVEVLSVLEERTSKPRG